MATYKKSFANKKKEFIFCNLSNYFENIGINQFNWKGIEEISDSLTSEIMERWLYEKATSVFFEDKSLGYMNLPYNINGGLNVYYKPTKVMAVGLGYTKSLMINKDCVIIRDNEMLIPKKQLIDFYCEKLADIELTMDVRRNAHKTPFIIESDDKTLLSAKNFFNDIESNEPVIYKNKNRSGELGIEVNDMQAEYINDRLNDEYNSYIAKILTVLGISNYVEDKAERVQSAEVNANQDYVQHSFDYQLELREKACDKINNMFGLSLSVEYNKPQMMDMSSLQTEENEEDEVNE